MSNKSNNMKSKKKNPYTRKTGKLRIKFPLVIELGNPRQMRGVVQTVKALAGGVDSEGGHLLESMLVRNYRNDMGEHCRWGVLIYQDGTGCDPYPFHNQLSQVPHYRFDTADVWN